MNSNLKSHLSSFISTLVLLLMVGGCGFKHPKDGYELISRPLGNDCELYVMVFENGDQRIAISGTCVDLNNSDFLLGVEDYLDSVEIEGKLYCDVSGYFEEIDNIKNQLLELHQGLIFY